MKKPAVPIPEIKPIPIPKKILNKKVSNDIERFAGILANDKTAVKAAKKRTID